MSKTLKKMYAVSCNATSSCRPCKSGGFCSLWKFVWKSNSSVACCYGRDLQQFPSEEWIIAALLCGPCERCLKNFIRSKTLISGKQISLERVNRLVEKSLSTIWSLKTFKHCPDKLVASVLQGTWWGLNFDFWEQNPKLKSGCYVWQILWLTNIWPWELSQGNFSK